MLDQNRKTGTCFAGTLQSYDTPKVKWGKGRKSTGEGGSGTRGQGTRGQGTRGQTGLPANFRQKAPEIHGSLVSPQGLFSEDEPFAGGEVQKGAQRDGEAAGHIVMDMEGADEESHQGEVAEDGDGAVAGVEARHAEGDIARRAAREMLPGVTLVPHEVVEHGGFHGERGGHHVVQMERTEEQREGAHLHHDAQGADCIELEPADSERSHGRRSAW